jgi:hypothetical protein
MSRLQAVFERLADVEATIAKVERNGGAAGDDFATQLAISSLEQRRAELKGLADELAEQELIDVCDYRILPNEWGRFPAKAVSGAISAFQDMFTAFFASVRENRPRHRAIFDADLVQASTLNIGYAYSGSLGIVMYVPSDQLFPSENDQDLAVQGIFQLAAQETSEGVKAIAEKFGRAPIRAFYEWSKVNIDYGMSSDVTWQRGTIKKSERLFQPEELAPIVEIIETYSETTEILETLTGILVALDVTRKTFKISFPDSPDIRGTFDENFNWKIPHKIPERYQAKLKKNITTQLWSENESTSWTLLNLTST